MAGSRPAASSTGPCWCRAGWLIQRGLPRALALLLVLGLSLSAVGLAALVPGRLALAAGDSLAITTPIGRRPHPPLGEIWCAAEAGDPAALAAHSQLTLLESGGEADLVEVAIVTGRPHQIRIHCAAVGAPLLGDPLYRPGGWARPGGLPGEGGYRLQARWLRLQRPDGSVLELEAPPAQDLATAAASQAG
ncbi:pseudouridine synthase [Synechococcus sp. BO 8801]|uniref:pseudouridine synthase n=1 Tax=Synechococcus sp. BO 8801 TaxID=169670 RepID=UPI001E461658|nr:pseudouridine synthase [Synechococcus sp. BO 8801]